ncbi:GIY-YIG nuclease family protein [Synechococcus sp. WH 8016]|uniref:GIY-YIG nuclease family protein n=1 Tax=Synechococcus sp. WH 8016 TaxID=166318 RepID=UPI00022D7D79|nr:GIY-YIG nuclease family protein [Synechococcus sp. WH 8016]EHA63773.1 helicase A859L [Synechococcus sp. WH 8016]
MTTAPAQRLQYLYLIASGNEDNIFKIGISHSPTQRLEQIKRDYNVPDAYILEFMDVPSRDEVFAIENALHTRFDSKQSTKYPGREWFKLSPKDLEDLRSLYQENSNSFAQASAYYGIIEEMERISDVAETEDMKRRKQIHHNRVHGKTYDTAPKGILKRYNDLSRKSSEGILASRFEFHRIQHPIVKALNEARNDILEIIGEKVKPCGLQVGVIGLMSGMVLGSAIAPAAVSPITWGTTAIGFIAGSISGAARKSKESEALTISLNNWADHEYPNTRLQTMEFIEDKTEHKSLLIRKYTESKPVLRKEPALMPRIDITQTITKPMKDRYSNKNYFPKVATVATIACAGFFGLASVEGQDNNRYSFEQTPPAIERLT